MPDWEMISRWADSLVPISLVRSQGWAQWSTIDLAVIVTTSAVKTWTCGLYRQWVTAISSFLSYHLWDSNKILNSKMDLKSIHKRDCVAGCVANWGWLRSSNYLSIWYAGLRDDFQVSRLVGSYIIGKISRVDAVVNYWPCGHSYPKAARILN